MAKLRQRLLGAVLLVAGDEHDVLALAGAVAPFVDDPGIVGPEQPGGRQQHQRSDDLIRVPHVDLSSRQSGFGLADAVYELPLRVAADQTREHD